VLASVESSEAECPLQEEDKGSTEELVFRSPARCRSNDRLHGRYSRSRETYVCFLQSDSCVVRLPAIVGHQLANGIRAPLLI